MPCSMFSALIEPFFANVGSVLMVGTAFHLFIGNTIIGIVEGRLLAWLFKAPRKRCILIMIPANYVSAWLGFWLVPKATSSADLDLYNVHQMVPILMGLTYAATLVIEWPFVAACLRNLRRSFLACLAVQTISYALMFGYYYMISSTSLLRDFEIVPAGGIPLPERVEVYFIGNGDGNVYRLRSSTAAPEMIYELKSRNSQERLTWLADEAIPEQGSLAVVKLENTRFGHPLGILKNYPGESARKQFTVESIWDTFGDVEPVARHMTRKWKFSAGFWAGKGLEGEPAGIQEAEAHHKSRIHLALEMPCASWLVRNAMQLPGDIVLFQLGEDQICLFDPVTNRVALLCRGRGPVAVMVPGK